jgi:hypothetical protein
MGYGPLVNGTQHLEGLFRFRASSIRFPAVADEFWLRIAISAPLETALPEVFEEGGRIPRLTANHVNPDDSLCLGSPLRKRLAMGGSATLQAFTERCIVPFLYARVLREQGLDYFPFGELEHGAAGLTQDYQDIFQLEDATQLRPLLKLLTMDPEVAYRQVCPCCLSQSFESCLSSMKARIIAEGFSEQELRTAYSQLFDD